jgi:N-acetylmuramoyl-L-alanine amidase
MSRRICIDAGHGGKDPGAVNNKVGARESLINLSVCRRLGELLRAAGCTVHLTRSTDVFIAINERARMSNNFKANIFVSVHCNSDGPTAIGVETLYRSNNGLAIATPVQRALVAATKDRDRGLKHRINLGVLNGTFAPAILPEIGFVSHEPTALKLVTEGYQQLIAKAISDGIRAFLKV